MHPQYYYDVYLLIVLVFTLYSYTRYRGRVYDPCWEEEAFQLPQKETLGVILMIFMVLFVGTRPISGRYFADMANYYQGYRSMEGSAFHFDFSQGDPLWTNTMAWWASKRLGYTSFMVLDAVIYFGGGYWACCRFFPRDRVAAYLVFLGAFSTFSYGTNGMRAGVAGILFLLALSYAGNWVVAVPLVIASYYMHHSMVMPAFAFVAALTYRKTNVYLAVWAVCILIAALHITWFQELFAQLSADSGDTHGAGYLDTQRSSDGWYTGFRLDFILYSAMPVAVSYYTVLKKRIQSDYYSFLINIYLICNSLWMLCMYASFTNRIAYLSWLMYPVVLVFPFLREEWGENRYKIFSLVMLGHMAFTLVMHFVYYK